MKIVWSERSRLDLRDIADHIAKTLRLNRFPLSGRIVPELPAMPIPLREILINDYRLVYRVHGKRLEIVTLFHGAKQLRVT